MKSVNNDVKSAAINSKKQHQARHVVLSGIRATGRLHLGNYLGAVKGMLALQNDPAYQTLYMVADVHTLTTPFDPQLLQKNRLEVVKDYLAAGLDPKKSTIFLQAEVPAHLELTFYFSTVTSVARMQHLPTFKDKVKQHPENVTMALLNYPILMAADILAYQADKVPVGIDQEPHLEIAREVARKMNERFQTNFPEPTRFATPGEYVPSLKGEGKMSKSVEGSFINLTDDLSQIQARLAGTPTDGGQGKLEQMPAGVRNLLTLVELFQGQDQRQTYEAMYQSTGIRYRELKTQLAEAIYQELAPVQKKRQELEKNMDYVYGVIEEGATKAQALANQTVTMVKEKMGLGAYHL